MHTVLLLKFVLLIVNCVCCVKVTSRGKSSSITTKGYATSEAVSTGATTTTEFPDSVQNLTVSDVTSSSFIVSWKPPRSTTGVVITTYVVHINCSNAAIDDSCEEGCSEVRDTVDANRTIYIFENATPYTAYEVKVIPESNEGKWLPATTSFFTDEDLPDEPENLSVSETNGEVTVIWDPPKCKRGLLMYYNIQICCIKSEGPNCPCPQNSSTSSRVQASSTNETFYGIRAFSMYSVSVSAETKKGAGDSVAKNFSTSEGVPDNPKNLSVSESNGTLSLIWEPPRCSRGELLYYQVDISCKVSNGPDCPCPPNSSIHFREQPSITNATFTRVHPYSEYSVTVAAATVIGVGNATEVLFNTAEDVPDKPTNVSVSESNGTLSVIWDPPVCSHGVVLGYRVVITCMMSRDGPACPCPENSSASFSTPEYVTEITFDGAHPFSEYSISVAAETKIGPGNQYEVFFNTTEAVPDKPTNVSVSESNGTLSVIWDPPVCSHGVVLGYRVVITCMMSRDGPACPCPENSSASFSTPEYVTEITFDGAHPFSEYSISVAAETKICPGNPYEVFFNTTEAVPDSPENISIINITSKGFDVVWDRPTCVNGKLENYVVTVDYIYEEEMNCKPPLKHHWSFLCAEDATEFSFSSGWPFSKYNVSVITVASGGNSSSYPQEAKTLEDIPDDPANVSIINITSKGFDVVWDRPTCINGKLKNYVVTVDYIYEEEMNCESPLEHHWSFPCAEDATEFPFSSGWPFSKYNVSVITVASGGNSSSYPQEAKTLEDIPDQPEDLSVSSDFIIKWKQPPCTNGILQMYYVTITFLGPVQYSEDCPGKDNKTYSFIVPANIKDYQFIEEEPYSKYKICVNAATVVGNGSDICKNTQSTATVLGGPRVLEVESLNSSAANITWKIPCPITDEIIKFSGHMHGHRPGFDNDIKHFKQQADVFYYIIDDLKPEYKYSLMMFAYGSVIGKGVNSFTRFQQPAGIPGVLQNVSKDLQSNPFSAYDPTRQAVISVPVSIFDSANGNIISYAIFVAPYSVAQNSTSGYLEIPIQLSNCNKTWPNTSYWGDTTVNGVPSGEYQATPDCWCPSESGGIFTFVLGTDKTCGTHQYCNGPLHPHTEYTFKVRAYTSHGYRDSYVVAFHTDSEVAVGLTLGLVFGFLMAGTVLFGYVMYRNGQISCSLSSILNKHDTRDVCPRPIPLKNFAKHCELLLDIPGRLSSEFQLLSTLCVDINETNTFSIGRLPDNKRKNRYINILPFDANRVKLEIVDNDPSSDYINASFIQGYSKNIEYIATQGPKEETVKDFWLMVYQYNVKIIVMVTQLEEQGKVKCHQYYPNLRETEKYGDISVKCTTELQFAIYTSRTIMLMKGKERKKIVHLHFREWPDFGSPATTDVMLQFCQIVRHQILLSSMGLTLVHCSAGVGRTGTLIALDILLQHIRENKTVDIFGVVYNLRKQRTNMVQSEAQYGYIYRCVRDALADTTYPKHDKTSTSSLEPICESAGPALNAAVHDNSRRRSVKSNITENEYEL